MTQQLTLGYDSPQKSEFIESENLKIKYYENYFNLDESTRLLVPNQCYVTPTADDYTLGSFTRYFCVKINQPLYLELNVETYDKLNDKDIAYLWQPYIPFKIQWTIAGSEDEVEQTNRNVVLIEERRNNRLNFFLFLKNNFLKFYI